MKKRKILTALMIQSALCLPLTNFAETKPKTNKDAEKEKKEIENQFLEDYNNRKPYNRDTVRQLPSPFRNLIVVERIRLKQKEEELAKAKALEELNQKLTTENQQKTPETSNDPVVRKFRILTEMKAQMPEVEALVSKRQYAMAEDKIKLMSLNLSKNGIQDDFVETLNNRYKEVVAEHKDWDDLNSIINSLNVEAMFVTEGKNKIALINGNAVEEGDDLNEHLSLNKGAAVILNHVSNNAIKIQYKKFTLQKDLIDEDL